MYDKFWNRVIFPIMDVNNRVIGFGGRVMGDGKPKYLNSPETKIFDKSRNLYGLNVARTTRKNYLILCEGYMDVISMHQAGFTNAVASLGTALTSGHASLVKRYTRKSCFCMTVMMQVYGRHFVPFRSCGKRSHFQSSKSEAHKDPDEFIKSMKEQRPLRKGWRQATDSFMFRVSIASGNFRWMNPRDRIGFLSGVPSMLLELSDELERNLYIEAIVKEYGRYGVSVEDSEEGQYAGSEGNACREADPAKIRRLSRKEKGDPLQRKHRS